MIGRLFFLFLFIGCFAGMQAQRSILFDADWRFFRGDDSTAESNNYNDAVWRKIELPHDWSIEDLPGTNSPFDSTAAGQVHTGFTTGGTAWYRKTFSLPAGNKSKRIIIQFDGVYMNADFWMNGAHLGNHPYGYTPFYFDVTDHLNWNGRNTIAIRVKNEGRNSRWYSGSGIYRHVWLSIVNPVHIAQWGTSITTPVVNKAVAIVNLQTIVQNESGSTANIKIITSIKDEAGKIKSTDSTLKQIAAEEKMEIKQSSRIASPALWSIERPALYMAVTKIYRNNKLIDSLRTPFGIRRIQFDALNGFRLNGKIVKLKGGCIHHDNGPLGASAYDRAEARKIALLKASGYNAIRTSHNPPSPALLNACDRMGILVIEEAFDTWNEKKNKNDYNLYFKEWWKNDLQSMICRDRNHPSIIMWSSGNEIPNRGKDEVARVAKELTAFIKGLDSTRPVTAGINGIDQKPDAFTNAVDIPGYNYADKSYEADHIRFPQRVIYGSESYALDAFDYWMQTLDHPYVIGDFVWTAFDYIGEASIGWLGYPQSKKFYPWNLAYCGDIDICGWKRPQSFYRDALWKKDQLSIFVRPPRPTFREWNEKLESWSRWNWQDVVANWSWEGYEDSLMPVEVYSSCDSVALFLNEKLIDKKATGRSQKFMANFMVPYQPGALRAVGYTANKKVAVSKLQTSGDVAAITLSADRVVLKAGQQDLSYITLEIVDAKGQRDMRAESSVSFTIDGPATIAGVANANPKNTQSFQSSGINTWQGRCLLIIKAINQPGNITVTASVPGLPPSRLTLRSAQ